MSYFFEVNMNISAVAKRSGLSAKQIRDYEKMGLLPHAKRSESGYRIYTEDDLTRLIFISNARKVDFSLLQIKQLLMLNDNSNRTSREVKEITAEQIGKIEEKITRLQEMLGILRHLYAGCHGDENPNCSILKALHGKQEKA